MEQYYIKLGNSTSALQGSIIGLTGDLGRAEHLTEASV